MSYKIHRVELNNFKSYAGSINIGPLTNFTCIVGPNGSGKSNLMDAISFALTSTSTRSKQHTDFINRNSGATSCSVTIVLRPILANHNINDNNNKKKTKDAADEVSFTRRVDDDGEMRVAVNGKDVSERLYTKTLADYRVGSNANTFLVYQHEVELVAQQQAKQLTDLLEKVSGSGELKHDYNQKKAALTAANEALSNASVEKRGAAAQVQQLRLAKKDTERFEELRNTCVEERQEVALAELFFVEGQLEQQKSELHKFSHQLETLRAKITTSDDINNMKRSYAQEHKKYLEELKKNRHLTEEVRNKHNTRERIQAAMAHLTRKLEIATLELKTAQAADTRRAAEIARLEATKEEHVATLKAFEDAIAREDADETNAQQHLTAAHLADFRRLKKEAACATVALRQQLDTLHRKRDGVLEAQRLVEHAREAAALHRSDMSQGRERTVAKQHELKQRQAELSAQIDALTQEVLHTQKDLAQMQRKSAERELDLAKVEEQLHELRHLKDDGKQATRMSDAIQALRALFPIRGRLVDLCNIPNERYRNAITVAMGKNLDAMVVDRTELAIQCVRYLKEQHMPPITFLPLDGLQGKQVDDRLRTFGGTCKPAMDLVRCEAEVEPALRYALGQTLVCDEVVEARKVAYQHPSGERFKVVTLDGTTLLKNGVVQGGLASIATRARRWDEKKYDDLRAHRERLMSGAGSEAELARANLGLRDVEARLDYAKKRKEVVAADIVAVEAKLAGLVAELAKQDAADAQLAERATDYANSIHVLEAEALGINKSIAHVETNIFADLQQKVDVSKLLLMESQVAQRATQRAQRRQDLQLLIHRLESSIEMEKLRLGGHTSQETRQLCARLEKEKKKCETDFATYNTIVAKAEASVAGLKSSVAAQRRELDAMEERIRHATRQSETELRRLDLARKGSTALVAACDALRLRRANIIRECQMSEVELPLKPFVASKRQRGAEAGSSTTNDGGLQHSEPFSLVVGEIITPTTTSSSSSSSSRSVKEEPHKVFLDFSSLSDARRQVCHSRERFDAFKTAALAHVDQLESEMEALAPSLKAATRCHASEDRLGQTTTHVEAAREAAKKAQAAFQHVKELRTERFLKVFHEVAAAVNRIYQDLTLGTRANAVHGSAYLTLEDAEEPYLGGTTYHATPPLKRFMPMELLSGGEKTMAALALLFAIHAVSPTPFFVLDEVDAALDAGNVEKLAHYLRTSSSTCQFLVVSLKEQLYHTAEMLVGVMKDAERTSSKIITMDLRGFPY